MAGTDDIKGRLAEMKAPQLRQLLSEIGMSSLARGSAASMRDAVGKSIVAAARFGGKNSVASQSGGWSKNTSGGVDFSKVDAASDKARLQQIDRVVGALDKAQASAAAAKQPKAKAAKGVKAPAASSAPMSRAGHVEAVKAGLVEKLQSGSGAKLDAAVSALNSDKALKAADVKAIAQESGVIRTNGRGKAGMVESIKAHGQWLTYNRDADVMSARNNMFGSFSPASADAERAAQTARYVDNVKASSAPAPAPAPAPKVTKLRADAVKAKSRAQFDAVRIAQQDAMMDRLVTGEQRLAEIAARRSGKVQAPSTTSAHPAAKVGAIRPAAPAVPAQGAGPRPVPVPFAGKSAPSRPQPDLTRMAQAASIAVPKPGPPSLGRQALDVYAKAAPALGIAALAWQAMGAYRRARDPDAVGGNQTNRDALISAGKAVAPGVAIAALGMASKTAGKLILPAMAAWSAYQGAREDTGSMVRGAGRGVVRALDPTQLFMTRGVGERAYDAAFGQAPRPAAPSFWDTGPRAPVDVEQQFQKLRDGISKKLGETGSPASISGGPLRLTSSQQQQFASADKQYRASADHAAAARQKAKGESKGRGYANPNNQVANQRGRGVQNITAWAASGNAFPGAKRV